MKEFFKANKKMTYIVLGIAAWCLIAFVKNIISPATPEKATPMVIPKIDSLPEPQIHIEHIVTKDVDGLNRYFFRISNQDSINPFFGTINISLKDSGGKEITRESFSNKTSQNPIVKGIFQTVFIDSKDKMASFEYESKR